jgi:hypothetical protein
MVGCGMRVTMHGPAHILFKPMGLAMGFDHTQVILHGLKTLSQ